MANDNPNPNKKTNVLQESLNILLTHDSLDNLTNKTRHDTKDPVDANPITTEAVGAAEAQIVAHHIKSDTTTYTIESLIQKLSDGELLAPTYRFGSPWTVEQTSLFIESLLMGLPTPPMYFWDRPDDGRLEIVDGLQRLRAIEAFVLGDFQLSHLKNLKLLSGFRFADLLESRQRRTMKRLISGVILHEQTDVQTCIDMANRINN